LECEAAVELDEESENVKAASMENKLVGDSAGISVDEKAVYSVSKMEK
jgi:hypothetical protein